MKLSSVLALLTTAMLSTPVLACKCYTNNKLNTSKTKSCCSKLNGVFQYGDDCMASSISQRLSNFRSCCGGQSDCDYFQAPKAESGPDGQEADLIKTLVPAAPTAV